jgi:hypothetical protein
VQASRHDGFVEQVIGDDAVIEDERPQSECERDDGARDEVRGSSSDTSQEALHHAVDLARRLHVRRMPAALEDIHVRSFRHAAGMRERNDPVFRAPNHEQRHADLREPVTDEHVLMPTAEDVVGD